MHGINRLDGNSLLDWVVLGSVTRGACARYVLGDCMDIGSGTTCGPYSLAPCAHHVAPSTEYLVCPSSEYSTAVTLCIVHWSFLVVELGERSEPWSEL